MNDVGFYGNLEVITNRMAGLLLSNKEFCKYLYYTDDKPLEHEDVIDTINTVLNQKFILQPKSENVTYESGAYVELFFGGDNPERQNGGMITKFFMVFNIMCSSDVWRMFDGIRVYRLMNIIDKTFNGKHIKDISFSQILSMGSKFLKFSDSMEGYKLIYTLTWNGNSVC